LAGHALDLIGGPEDFAHILAQRAAGGEGVKDFFAVSGEDHEEIVGFVEDAASEAGSGGGGCLVGGSFFEGRIGRRGRRGVASALNEDEVGSLIIPALKAEEFPVVMKARGERQAGEETGDSQGGEFRGSHFEVLQEGAVAGDELASGFNQGDWSWQQSHDILIVTAL